MYIELFDVSMTEADGITREKPFVSRAREETVGDDNGEVSENSEPG